MGRAPYFASIFPVSPVLKHASQDASADYCKGIRVLGGYGDYLVVNVSSPNTPGLRALQRRGAIKEVILAAMVARDQVWFLVM